jgi:hypothetical protein
MHAATQFLVLAIIPVAALLLILVGTALESWSRRDILRRQCGSGHVWWVRADDAKAYGQYAAQCPWCRYDVG